MYPPACTADPDAPIRSTDNDAALARLSATRKGYFEDNFINHFVPRANFQPARPPLINIGTYVRSTAIDELVDQWLILSGDTKCQIVSLGAGSDTRFWRIASGPNQDKLATYLEVDFPEITSKKAMSVRKSKELSSILGNPEDIKLAQGGVGLHSPRYHLLPVDLRLPPSQTLEKLLVTKTGDQNPSSILTPTLPTLLIFECVLVYMSPEASSGLLKWFIQYFSSAEKGSSESVLGCLVYEMFGLNDSFGRVMMNNLKMRNISLPGVDPYTTIDALPKRFYDVGFTTAGALTLRDIRQNYIDANDLTRISNLEMLDEVEELELVLSHYAVSWGFFTPSQSIQEAWEAWRLKPKSKEDEPED